MRKKRPTGVRFAFSSLNHLNFARFRSRTAYAPGMVMNSSRAGEGNKLTYAVTVREKF